MSEFLGWSSRSHDGRRRVTTLLATALLWAASPPADAQVPDRPKSSRKPTDSATRDRPTAEADDTAASAEDANERRAVERFLTLVEKNPRRGTALDRVYGFHVERGTLDAFIKTIQDRVAKDPNDGAGWMILGLLESQRGRDAAAVAAFKKGEAARADDPMTSYYLGQALVLVGQPDEAASAFERSIERKPRRNDLLDIFQALGRVYQRTQKTDKALAVWNRLEALFPADVRVQEQIASALAEEGQTEQALPRFEALAKKVTDPFRQVQLAMQAADLKVRLGRTEPALKEYEGLLAKLRPDSWLFREVRRKVEEVFLRNDDQAGLAAYYERWIVRNSEDIEALVRLARTLTNLGRTVEARKRYDKAVALAPSRRDLRLALISQLELDKKFDEAAAQYAALDKSEPNNPDTLRDWGALLLRDTTKPEPARKQAASAVWRRLLEARPTDPVTTAQVADLLRQADLVDDAVALDRKAIALAPDNPQYHEYLGEYLHTLKRSDEALAAWSKIAEGPNRNSKNLGRLGEVLSGFGYVKQAVEPMSEAVKLEGDDFTLRLKLAELFFKVERYDDSRVELAAAARLSEKDEEKAAVLEAEVKTDQASGKLAARVAELSKAVEANPKATAEERSKLARYLEADGKLPEASRAIESAIATDPRSVPSWTLAARIRESAGNLADAAEAFRRLAEIDRRNRTEYLTGVAKLESRLGRIDAALKAGRDLIADAPGNPESYQFFADLCFQLGKTDEGLDALRRAARVNPNDTKVVLTLADTLAGQFRTDEAIEMYWRAFEKSDDLEARVDVVPKLTDLYIQKNQFDRLLARLQRQDQETGRQPTQQQQREQAICLAQAYASSGDVGSARSELERLLAANTRDTQLLQQLAKLAEDEGDLESAARYQKQLNELAPSDESTTKLAVLYARAGELEEAQALWTKLAAGQAEPAKVLTSIDNLLGNDKPKAVLEITETLVRKDPGDWEALYREGVALQALGRVDDASRRFQALLELRANDDDSSAIVKARNRDPKLRSAGARPSAFARNVMNPLDTRANMAFQIRMATKLETRNVYYAAGTTRTSWAPTDFGQARMAALGWLYGQALKQNKGQDKEFVNRYRSATEKSPADPRTLWDWYYLSVVRTDSTQAYEAARALSRAAASEPTALLVYLNALGSRLVGLSPRIVNRSVVVNDNAPPLPAAELDHALECFRALRQRRPDLVGPQAISNVVAELKRARRTDDEEKVYRETVEGAQQPIQVFAALSLAAQRGDVDALLTLFDRLERQSANQQAGSYASGYFVGLWNSLGQAMGLRGEAKAYGDVLRILDHYLAHARRVHDDQSASARNRSRTGSSALPVGYVQNYQFWIGKAARRVQIAHPLPNAYFDTGAIALLRGAYEVYKRDDLGTDLLAHFRKECEAAKTPSDALYPRMALSYLLWWDDDKDASTAEFARAAEGVQSDPEMKLTLAELYQQRGDVAEALAQADSFQPADNATMLRREELALRLAVRSGNTERARQAAERLFGLRLDTDTQLRLTEHMHQLGMHEMAEAVLARARRRVGNKASALVGLMLQYQRQNKNEIAVQVAMQILRNTTSSRPSNPNVYNPDEPDAARGSAVQVLARSGKLADLITRTEEQIQRTPGSASLRLTLGDYYSAAGQRDKGRAELNKLVALRPDDVPLRLKVATTLTQEGQAAAAVEHYKVILKKDPAQLNRNFFQVINAFQQAGKTDDLVQILEQTDIRSLGQSYQVMNVVQNLMNDPRNRDKALTLFRKAWEAFPAERENLFNYLYRDEFWQLPEMFDYARQALIPDTDSGSYFLLGQWNSFQQVMSTSMDGTVTTLVSRLLDLASSQNKLGELSKRTEEGTARFPGWVAGKALLALIRAREGKYAESKELLQPVLKVSTDEIGSAYPDWVIGAELEKHVETRDLARTFYERSVNNRSDNSILQYDYSPMKRLVEMYVRDGRKEDARRVLLGYAKPRDSTNVFNQDYEIQMRLQSLGSVGNQLINLGFAADAVPLLNEAVELADSIATDGPNYIGNLPQVVQQARDGMSRSLQSLKGDQLVPTVLRMLEPRASGSDKDRGKAAGEPAGTATSGRGQPVDLVLLVAPRELDKATVRSLFDESISALAGDPNNLKTVGQPINALLKGHPDDLSVRIAATLTALAENDSSRATEALNALEACVQKNPLEKLSPGSRANARQRIEAARQMSLWLVARACWTRAATLEKENKDKEPPTGRADLRAVGDRLAERALAAAARQSDNRWTFAMLRERGQQALDRGDRTGAEVAWGKMLDQVLLPESRVQPSSPAAVSPLVPGASPAPVPPPPAPPPTPPAPAPAPAKAAIRPASYQPPGTAKVETSVRPVGTLPAGAATVPGSPTPTTQPRPAAAGVPVLTIDRFEQAMQVARLAEQNGLHALSLRALRESLKGGPPVQVAASPSAARMRVVTRPGMVEPVDPVVPKVVNQLSGLDTLFQRQKAPAVEVYEALRDVVLPRARPSEIFLYAQPLSTGRLQRKPESAGAMLAAWAARADRADDLRKNVEARSGQPQNGLAAAVLLVQLAVATTDDTRANASLQAVLGRIKRDTLRTTTELACHAAMPAVDRPATAAAALEVLDVATTGMESPNPNVSQVDPVSSLSLFVARRQLKRGDTAAARKRLNAYVESTERSAIRFGGDYPHYLRKQALGQVASEFARAGNHDDALATLGQFADAPAYSGGDPPTGASLPMLAAQLSALPAKARYERLRAWTLPTGDRRLVRMLRFAGSGVAAPPLFFTNQSAEGPTVSPSSTERVETTSLLIDSARQAGTLDALAMEVAALAEQKEKVENARELFWLVELARGRGEQVRPQIEVRLAELIKEGVPAPQPPGVPIRSVNSRPRIFPWVDLDLARAAVAQESEPLIDLGLRIYEALLVPGRVNSYDPTLASLHLERADAQARRAGSRAVRGSDGGVRDWHPAPYFASYSEMSPSAPSTWLVHQGHVAHVAGPELESLLFDYPLTGTYELSVDAYNGAFSESAVTVNGLVFEPFGEGPALIYPLGRSETVMRPWRLNRSDSFNHLTVKVSPATVRYLVNGHLFYEDKDPSPTSPWIGLFTRRDRLSAWKNITLTGNPIVPREVRLSHADRLDGWISSFYSETQPPRRSIGEPVPDPNALMSPGGASVYVRSRANDASRNPDDYDWSSRDGDIVGRRMPDRPIGSPNQFPFNPGMSETGNEAVQSRLYYARPLRNGDAITYEFLYEPEKTLANPSIDRIAFLLEPAGVRLHWMTAGPGDPSGLPADNAADEPSNRRGPNPLPLKSGAWNTMKVALEGETVTLELNGEPVYQHRLDPTGGRQFGFFHYKDRTAARVRHVVQKGRWPGSLSADQLANLIAPRSSEAVPEPDRRARHAIIGEHVLGLQESEILRRAAKLNPEDRYELLAVWVLPTPDHPVVRLAGEFTPTDPAPHGSPAPDGSSKATRVESGGELRAPVIGLVAAAEAAGKLEELEKRAVEAKAEGNANQRGRLALIGLIQIARNNDNGCKTTFDAIKPLLAQVNLDERLWQRWPELTLASRAIERPALRQAALEVLGVMVDQAQKKSPSGLWEHQVKHLRARAQALSEAVAGQPARPFGVDPDAPGWARVIHARAETRGQGEPLPHWTARDGQFTHHPGPANDFLYLGVPLRGDFQLDCELTSFDWREMRVSYAGMTVGPKFDLKTVERSSFGRRLSDVVINPPLEKLGDWYKYRLVVHDGTMTSFVNGRKVHEAPVPAERDPWLALHCPAQVTGSARNIAITGEPAVPESLNLSALPDLTGWIADYYLESVTGNNPDWLKQGTEILGQARRESPGSKQESVLRYNRPMLEDGEISYEFYYEPGKVLAHPALDRLTFLLDPDGVKVHWMTDAQHDRSGLEPDNSTVEADTRRGSASLPLKPNTWNVLRLALSGDRVTLKLNGEVVAERTLEPTNQRIFGLFHFADETEARVRNVTYRGQWPRSLPASVRSSRAEAAGAGSGR